MEVLWVLSMSKGLYLAFLAGGAIAGALASYIFLKEKFEADLEKEKEGYKNLFDILSNSGQQEESLEPVMDEEKLESTVQLYSEVSKEPEKPVTKKEPYFINDDEFVNSNYEIASWEYYADGLIKDEDGEILDEAMYKKIFGDEVASELSINDFEQPSLYICDDDKKIIYELINQDCECPYVF